MGIDIYAQWDGQSEEEQNEQYAAAFSTGAGGIGYLREAYHGEPYATRYLMPEAFEDGDGASIPAATLRGRLPETLRLVELRERQLYGETNTEEMAPVLDSFIRFVELCEWMEKATGKPVRIIASW